MFGFGPDGTALENDVNITQSHGSCYFHEDFYVCGNLQLKISK